MLHGEAVSKIARMCMQFKHYIQAPRAPELIMNPRSTELSLLLKTLKSQRSHAMLVIVIRDLLISVILTLTLCAHRLYIQTTSTPLSQPSLFQVV